MTTFNPTFPASVTVSPFGSVMNLVSVWGRSSMLSGWPFLNSIVTRSYPTSACAPVRTSLTSADGGGLVPVNDEEAPQMYCTTGVGLGLGEGAGAGEALGVCEPPPPGTSGPRFRGLPTSSTPTRITAITAAARAAIHTGPRRSGASTRAERTRSDRAGSGDPLMESNASPSSRRKSSRVISEHLLEGQIRAQLASCSVDA